MIYIIIAWYIIGVTSYFIEIKREEGYVSVKDFLIGVTFAGLLGLITLFIVFYVNFGDTFQDILDKKIF